MKIDKLTQDDSLQIFHEKTAGWFLETFGQPTRVQEEAWPAIAQGRHTLVSAPTGTGKTLSAFLVFVDRLAEQARSGSLGEELKLIYVSPLKSLAGDIRENLNRPLEGIDGGYAKAKLRVGIRTGDTPQSERSRMVKHPPHILITTPESLYLMLTSRSGQGILRTAEAIIIDELHALIDTKRGAHLMLSVARLDALCGRNLQRIGLSATIEPLDTAAAYLAPEPVTVAAPPMTKKMCVEVTGVLAEPGRKRNDPVWEEIAAAVYQKCQTASANGNASVIAFSEARRYAEKLAYYVNQLGGEDYARVHHGSVSKEQRIETEEALRRGEIKLLCATSSMELGIDVGDIQMVLQVGCPRTVSSTMQRLGRAGHNPGRISHMYMYARTAQETLFCGLTAQAALSGTVEHAQPPRLCLDVLAQHLVSMAAGEGYTVEDVMAILARTYSFKEVRREDVEGVLRMLSGDYEHEREIPVRPRILYDRIHGKVSGDAYSRMLAVAAGGTIPDKGLYTVKTEAGVKLGELDEEFIYESQLGDKFLLGAFAWKIVGTDRDTVTVTQVPAQGARPPFWKGETAGRSLEASLAFGKMLRGLGQASGEGTLSDKLAAMGLDDTAAGSVEDLIKRQLTATGCLPDDRTILAEHFKDENGNHQLMFHALFGKRVNAPLSLLVQQAAREMGGQNVGCVEEDAGFLLYPYGEEALPEGLLYRIEPEQVRERLEAILPVTPVFSMTFRYNAARALMMGMHRNGRQPLWLQRLRSTQLLDSVIQEEEHPLIRETRRECLEDRWDIEGVIKVLEQIRAGLITVREVYTDIPSAMSLPLRWKVEADQMYEYTPVTQGIRDAAYSELKAMDKLKPSPEELARVQERRKLPEDEEQLHSLLLMEGDLTAGELEIPVEWLESLAHAGRVLYREPGLWIAAEHAEEYAAALDQETPAEEGSDRWEARAHIVRRLLYYRGAQSAAWIAGRYFLSEQEAGQTLSKLAEAGSLVEDDGIYYHAKLYDRARNNTIRSMRMEAVTYPAGRYAALLLRRDFLQAPPQEQLKRAVETLADKEYPASFWENILFARRISGYREALLDSLLAQGEYSWQLLPGGNLCFHRSEDTEWEAGAVNPDAREGSPAPAEKPPVTAPAGMLMGDERLLYEELRIRGASFLKTLARLPQSGDTQETLLRLAEKGLVCADSFVPVRQWQNQEKVKKATVRQRVNARVMALSAGRWDIVRPVRARKKEELLDRLLSETILLCRETFREAMAGFGSRLPQFSWSDALEVLRIWEYTGQVRRGYFIEGMSGAQFVRGQDYNAVMAALREEEKTMLWVNAADPAQPWGKALTHLPERTFLNVPGTAVGLCGAVPAAVLERQGKVLRVFAWEELPALMQEFVKSFQKKSIFPGVNRLVLKEYPEEAGQALKAAGFQKEMQDYVLYR